MRSPSPFHLHFPSAFVVFVAQQFNDHIITQGLCLAPNNNCQMRIGAFLNFVLKE